MDKRSPDVADLYDETILDDATLTDGQRLELHAERPQITTRRVEGQRAVITRRVVTVRRTIDVDVAHEELHVEYRDGSGMAMPDEDAQPIVVRLRAEEIEIVKRTRVVEEVTLSKRSVTEMQPTRLVVRHEELTIGER